MQKLIKHTGADIVMGGMDEEEQPDEICKKVAAMLSKNGASPGEGQGQQKWKQQRQPDSKGEGKALIGARKSTQSMGKGKGKNWY